MENLEIAAPHGISNLFRRRPVLFQGHSEFLRIGQHQEETLTRLQRQAEGRSEPDFEELRARADVISPEVARQLEQEDIGRIPPRFIRHRQMEGFVADLEMLPDQVSNLRLEPWESLSRPLHAMAPLGS